MLFEYFDNAEFTQPYLLLLLAVIPLLIFWYVRNVNRQSASVMLSTNEANGLTSWKTSFRHLPFVLRLLAIASIILALANPQVRDERQHIEGEGIDIMLSIDVSGSMTAQDFQPNRLEAAKNVAIDFINQRPSDRIGVVIFAGESFTQCPLTTDKSVLVSAVRNIRNGLLEDGTAIGSGLATAVDRLRNSKSVSKIVVLLTDGENNGGLIDPATALDIAKTYGVKVYTIGVGTDGFAPQPVMTDMGVVIKTQKVSIDEKLLTEIAVQTGGRYFRAKDNKALEQIYANISQLERSKVEITRNTRYKAKFFPIIGLAILFLLLEMLFRYLILRKFP